MDLRNISLNTHTSIRIGGSRIIYFDPFQINEEKHDADFIFITHEHFDHLDPDSVRKITKDDSVIIAPESIKAKLVADLSIDEGKCIFVKPGEALETGGLAIEAVPAYNVGKPFHPKENEWVGYIVKMDDVSYYVAGDTDVNDDIRKISCDVALIPVGGTYTMDKDQAADFICEIKPKAVIPTHYGSVVGDADDGRIFMEKINSADSEIQVELKL